jgi:hypothetical protein
MKKILFNLICLIAVVSAATTSNAQSGLPDLTFSNDGQLGFLDFPNDILPADILQTNGQIFALLSSVNGGQDSFILKLHDDGSYDESFGTSGILTLSNTLLYDGVLSADANEIYLVAIVNQVYSIGSINLDGSAVQNWTPIPSATGFSKILVDHEGDIIIGTGAVINNSSYGIVLKFNAQLQPITSFGVNGMATTPDSGFSYPLMEIDHDNRIVLATYNSGANMWRFNEDGTIDNTFNYTLDVSVFFLDNWILDFAIAPDNGIYVQPNTYANQSYLFKINSSGSIDVNFGQQGHIILTEDDPNLGAFPDELLAGPDGSLIILGSAFDASASMSGKFLARLDENGIVDMTFQGGPHVIDDNNYDLRINLHFATLQDDGKVLSIDQVALWQNGMLNGYNVLLTRFINDFAMDIPEDKSFAEISLFPNPTKDIVHFFFQEVNKMGENISVYDMSGKLVWQELLRQNQIDMSSFEDGLYTIVFREKNASVSRRIVKQ